MPDQGDRIKLNFTDFSVMNKNLWDIIVIGSGSGELSVGLFMAKAGFKVLMVSLSDKDIGGDCLNDGCVPSKAIIHVAKIIHNARGYIFKKCLGNSKFNFQIKSTPSL